MVREPARMRFVIDLPVEKGNACANDIETHSEEKLEKPKKFGNSEESAEGGFKFLRNGKLESKKWEIRSDLTRNDEICARDRLPGRYPSSSIFRYSDERLMSSCFATRACRRLSMRSLRGYTPLKLPHRIAQALFPFGRAKTRRPPRV